MAERDLPNLIQSLRPELYNEIYELIFSVESIEASTLGDKRVNKSYEPPSLLHVNRHTREIFSQLFYGNDSTFYCRKKEIAVKWLASLPKHHIEMIQHIRVRNYLWELTSVHWNRTRLDLYRLAMSLFRNSVRLTEDPIRFIDRVFEFEISPIFAETPKWVGLRRPYWRQFL